MIVLAENVSCNASYRCSGRKFRCDENSDGMTIERKGSLRYLGEILEETGLFTEHINEVILNCKSQKVGWMDFEGFQN